MPYCGRHAHREAYLDQPKRQHRRWPRRRERNRRATAARPKAGQGPSTRRCRSSTRADHEDRECRCPIRLPDPQWFQAAPGKRRRRNLAGHDREAPDAPLAGDRFGGGKTSARAADPLALSRSLLLKLLISGDLNLHTAVLSTPRVAVV